MFNHIILDVTKFRTVAKCTSNYMDLLKTYKSKNVVKNSNTSSASKQSEDYVCK